MNADDGHYGVQLAAEVLALRDSVEGWRSAGRSAGRPLGRPIDSVADRRLAEMLIKLARCMDQSCCSGPINTLCHLRCSRLFNAVQGQLLDFPSSHTFTFEVGH